MGTPRKRWIGPGREGWSGLTRAELVELGRKLFDAIESDRLDPDTEGETDGTPPTEGPPGQARQARRRPAEPHDPP